MRYSDLSGKEIVCIDEGIRLGVVDHTDLIINVAQVKWIPSLFLMEIGGFAPV